MKPVKMALWILSALGVLTSCGSNDSNGDTEPSDRESDAVDAGDTEGATDGDSETAVDLPRVTFDADDERILYTGRIDFTDPKAPAFSNGATYITARFTGVSLSVLMDFPTLYGDSRVYMDVQIDDDEPVILKPNPDADGKYEIATGLTNTEHKVTVVRRSQAERGKVTFLGFEVGGELLDPPERPTRRIQIVGDSIAAGEGVDVESASECSGDWSQDQQFTDMGKTFGPMLAKELDAEVHVIAWSGKGLYLNYDDTWDDRLMPELYELLYLEDKAEDAPKWDHTLFAPDAVLIELGTNDFGPSVTGDRTIDDVTPFVDAYITFVDTLLEYYPDVEIFALSSHLLEASRNDKLIEALDLLETSYADQGIDRVHAITDIKKVGAKGCNGHPNVEQHQAMADELEPTIKDVMGW